jgi:hypothetical protein
MQIFNKESYWEVVLQEVLEGTNLSTFLTLFQKLNSFQRYGHSTKLQNSAHSGSAFVPT